MPEIGAALREARMRQRIDISEIEAQTKIRAKYLRALENEEWELLPGPTFVKSFLRTYAEALDLDARLLLEEYKLRHERLSEQDLLPIAPPGNRREKARRPPGVGRDIAVALLVVALVGLLIVLGSNAREDEPEPRPAVATTAAEEPARPARTTPAKRPKPAVPKVARLELLPTGPVWVCLRAAGNRTLLDGEVIEPGTDLPVFRSSAFRMTFGNGDLALRVNGKRLSVPDVQNAIGYAVSRSGKRTMLPEAQRPTCS